MANPAITPRIFIVILVIAFSGFVLTFLFNRPLTILEDHGTSLRYSVRGDREVDTNIVLVYIDNEAIKSLGWPVRRNYHALMVKTLGELGAAAIGFEVQFETANTEYPEYDELLANVLSGSPSVLAAYFGAVNDTLSGQQSSSNPLLSYPQVRISGTAGSRTHLPLRGLMAASAGIGHLNINDDGSIPIFISGVEGIVPAFGLEVLRVYAGLSRDALAFSGSSLEFVAGASGRRIATDGRGNATPNFPASVSRFRAFPFLEVLRSYDAISSGGTPLVPVSAFKGKIVLVGIIAEGRSAFLPTPVHPRFPSLVYHATFIDNALQSSFLTSPGPITSGLVILLSAFLPAWAILTLRSWRAGGIVIAQFVLLAVVSVFAFTILQFILPIVPAFATGLWSVAITLLYRNRVSSNQVAQLQSEKDAIVARLKDREAKVTVLERQLMSLESSRPDDRTKALLEEIGKYKLEIRSLSSQADDMDTYSHEGDAGVTTFEGMVFHNHGPMKPVTDFVRKIASSNAPVLILGQSGTGKELVARAIHSQSPRASKSFIAVNCGALAETLLESELFGHERGAFTGAVKEKPGRFELADGGTIFLDEIGEVSEGFQLKLLRVLQEGELERVGGTDTIKVDVRVIAATNKNVREHVQAGRFREDLYYRLNVLTVELPSLKDRSEDIPYLVQHSVSREGCQGVSKNVMDAFQQYPWPGNVRELESVIKRAALLAKADARSVISMKDVTAEVAASFQRIGALEDKVLEIMRDKGFSRSAVSETATELGGLNRGTVAEHLRGQFLKAFVDNQFDLDNTVRFLSLSDDTEIRERARKRLEEYLLNIASVIEKQKPWEESSLLLKPKVKNLPLRFQIHVDQIGESYYRGLWDVNRENA